MTEVEVGLATVISYEHFAVFKRVHRARVNVDVRVKFLHRDTQATHLQQATERRRSESFAEGACNASRHEHMLRHVATPVDCSDGVSVRSHLDGMSAYP